MNPSPVAELPRFVAQPRALHAWILTVVSGLVLGLAQPKVDWGWLAWVAYGPLIYAVRAQPAKRAGQMAYTAAFIAFAIALYWIEVVVRVFGQVPVWLSWIPLLLLCAYCALWPALAVWWARKVEEKLPRLRLVWTLPLLLPAAEWLRGNLFTGFPWAHPAYSQYRYLPLIQIADVLGIEGILFILVLSGSGWVALVDTVCAAAGTQTVDGSRTSAVPVRRKADWLPTLAALASVVIMLAYGYLRLDQVRSEMAHSQTVRVALLQGNIPQDQKWDRAFRTATLDTYAKLTQQAVEAGADIVFWPETAAPFLYEPGADQESARLEGIVRASGAYAIIGAPAAEIRGDRYRSLNRAYLLGPDGTYISHYDKVHLVPFSEYVPLPALFGWVEKLVPVVGNFALGQRRDVLAIPGARFGVLICYESIFPHEVRDFVRNGAGFLSVITNDAWFLRTSATFQHISMAVMRAVENRVPVVQAGNTGVTAAIGPDGTILQALPIFQPGVLTTTVGLGSTPTFYTRYGDVFAYVTLICFVLTGFLVWRADRRSHST